MRQAVNPDPKRAEALALLTQPWLVFLLVSFYVGQGVETFWGGATTNRLLEADFVNMWAAAKLLWQNRIAVIFDPGAIHSAQEALFGQAFSFHFWSYPPTLLPFIAPFGLLGFLPALVAWTALGLAFYLLAVGLKTPQAGRLIGILALAPSTYQNIAVAQNGFFLAAALFAGLRLQERRPELSGFFLALASVKPQLVPLIPFMLLASRAYRALGVWALTLVGLVLLSLLAFGLEPWVLYLQQTAPFQRDVFLSPPIYAFQALSPTPFVALRFLGVGIPWALGLQGLATALTTFFVFRFFRKAPQTDPRRGFLVLALATFLVTPYALAYDMTLVSAALLLFLNEPREPLRFGQKTVFVFVWLLPILVFWLNASGLPIAPLLLALALWQSVKSGQPAPPSV